MSTLSSSSVSGERTRVNGKYSNFSLLSLLLNELKRALTIVEIKWFGCVRERENVS